MIPQNTGLISKIQTPFYSPERELSKHGVNFDLEVTGDVTGQVKVRMFDFSDFVTLVSTILMSSANKANESAWAVLLTCVGHFLCFVTMIQVKVISGHQVKKVKPKSNGIFSCDTCF